MARRFSGGKLVVASHNSGKLGEIAELLRPYAVRVLSAPALGLPEPAETGVSFIANAELKARAAADGATLPALADDSGLAVTALDGAPGIYSARWAGPAKDFQHAMQTVEDRLRASGALAPERRKAQFVSALCVAWPDGHVEEFEADVAGTLVWPPRGGNGFGYDAMFLPAGKTVTFGEMAPADKHAISHRAAAFRQLTGACFGR